jgi:hypothetical protein
MGFPQRKCEDESHNTNGSAPKETVTVSNSDSRKIRKNLIETAADIVHHKWDDNNGNHSTQQHHKTQT